MSERNSPTGKAKGAAARTASLSPERRSEIARKAASARHASSSADLPTATHIGELVLGDITLPCAVLPDGRRVLSQRGIMAALGRKHGGQDFKGSDDEDGGKLPVYLAAARLKPFISNELTTVVSSPIRYRTSRGGSPGLGVEAAILPQICDVWLKAREGGALYKAQETIAQRAEILMRGLAHVGIIALVDEATGYQKDRAKDALAQILEAFVAKELQPYVKTFPAEYYEEMFRLRGLKYPPENPRFRPQYFGLLTNDIVYERLAPGLLEDLKRQAQKDAKKAHLHRRLTQEVGHPRLREHLASVVTIMKLSNDYRDFMGKLNRIHQRYNAQTSLDLEEVDR